MKTIRDLLKHMDEDRREVTINLLITTFCNFECDHCFYGCGPYGSKAYMSQEMLWKVRKMVNELNRWQFSVSINLIGGEPTVNLKKFKEIWDTVTDWRDYPDVGIEMSTNGWWLKDARFAKQFFEIITPTAIRGAGIEEGLTIRISQDQYHQEFRTYTPNGTYHYDPERALAEILENGTLHDEPVIYENKGFCNECGHEVRDPYRKDCPSCHAKNCIEIESYELISLPEVDENMPWIYVEKSQRGADLVVPSGIRGDFGRNHHEYRKGNKGHGCYQDAKLTFTPDGKHTDGCCRGSLMPFGTIDDHPLVLLAMNWNFLEENEPDCFNCREAAKCWAQDAQARAFKRRLIKEVGTLVDEKELEEVL